MKVKKMLDIKNPSLPYVKDLFQIQRTCVYDGPGVRTTLFFKGCNLRCLWCQNPEMQSFDDKVSPPCKYSIPEIVEIVLRDNNYYQNSGGGVTLSGGEPLLQDPENLIPLLTELREKKVKISVETTLHAPWKNISKLAPYIDLFLVDLKAVGDEELHKKLTKQDSALIRANIKNLIDLKSNIKFRMVIVPGYNDSDNNIRLTSEFLKSLNYNSIELLKFHNMYEAKAKKYGIDFMPLHIGPKKSYEALKKAVDTFKIYGIKAESCELTPYPPKATFTPRVQEIWNTIRDSPRALCIESSKLKTKYYKKYKGFKKPTDIHRAERFAYMLQNKKITIWPKELLVGNFTSKRVACQAWEEYFGALPYIFVLYNINHQKPVSFKLSLKDKLYFLFNIAFYWWNYSLIGRVYPTIPSIIEEMSRASEMVVGFNNNRASIAHFIVNFDRLLTLGTTGIIEEIKAKAKEMPQKHQNFYKAAIISLEALENFAQRYAENLINLSKKEKDPERKKELEEMAEVCKHVPKYPARTFHEALQSCLFLQIALCHEAYENAISYGRFDQLLYPYYKRDLDAGRITYEKAKELICLFVLKIDEIHFVNDGNSLLSVNKLFETMSVDQTMTFGGVDKDGKDATNDITYMLIDACELQPYAIDPSARIHKDSPEKYLERLAEVYINGCPMPKVNSDDVYIKAILKHYPVTIEQARNYAIVGCVEPNASDDHFGNTDCANVNLALPFLQALKGHTYDLWKPASFGEILEKYATNIINWVDQEIFFGKSKLIKAFKSVYGKAIIGWNVRKGRYQYNPPSSIEELISRFQERLNAVTNSVLADHQKIERVLRYHFTTPLSSTLYKGCIESGKDLYRGGAKINSSGIQALGVTDVADSLFALNEVVFKKKMFPIEEVIKAIDANFEGPYYQKIRKALLAVPKFGDDSSKEAIEWENKVMEIYNKALESVPNCPRNGRYSAGYYALNVANRYGAKTPALPSGRLKGEPLANSVTPHYGMEQADLLSSLNCIAGVNFPEHAENGTTVTFTIDSALFQGSEGVKNLAQIFKTFLTTGGMQMQPNVINREILIDAYKHPEKHKYLMVRIAGYCAYFNELTDELKRSIIHRTYYH